MSKPGITELKQREARLWVELNEKIKEVAYQTRNSRIEIKFALEDRGSINFGKSPIPTEEYDPDGSLGRLYEHWKAAKAALDKALGR
jgi:hypothetical protein